MLGLVKNIFGRQKSKRSLRAVQVPLKVQGRYDAASTTEESHRHWANADLLSGRHDGQPDWSVQVAHLTVATDDLPSWFFKNSLPVV
jgi:hypothetical protein